MTLQNALNDFLFQKRLAGLSPKTVHDYNDSLSLLLRFLGADLKLSDVSYDKVTAYIMQLYDRPLSRATVSTYVRNIRIFLRWVYTEYDLPFDPVKIKVPKSPKKVVHIYNDDEIKEIFDLIRTSEPWITARNRTIVALMLDSGLRQSEICNLQKDNIDRSRMVMKVTGKGAKDRIVPLGHFSLALLENYLSQCPYKNKPCVFYNRRGETLTNNAVRLFVNRLQHKLPFSLSSHKLRHNFATNYCIDHVRETGKSDVYDLSILMGHESIETTKKYEHFAHEIIAAENNISHLDMCLGNQQNTDKKYGKNI